MSVCGNCPYPYEKGVSEELEEDENPCGWGCSHEDAAYRAQWAYDQLNERYENLVKWMKQNGYCLPFWVESYTEEEKEIRDKLCPTFWNVRDWMAYSEEQQPKI